MNRTLRIALCMWQLGGKRACRGRLGKDRSQSHSRHSIAGAVGSPLEAARQRYERRSGSLVLKAAHDAEEFYEDRGARISILAGRKPPRRDTLKQTDQTPISTKPLADGAAHTFSTKSTSSGHPGSRW